MFPTGAQLAKPKKDKRLRIAALFAGIGGIELGLHKSGHSTILLCENDPAATKVLQHHAERHFPGANFHPDVTDLEDIGDADVLTAGFPCQDLSQAGRTKGLNGEKSSLVAHVFRILEERRRQHRPVPWVIIENVSFMLRLARGHAMEYILDRFEALGYHWAYRVLDSNAFGLPQRRERVYFVASLDEDPRRVLFAGNERPPTLGSEVDHELAYGFYWTEGTRGLGWAENAVPTLKGGSTLGIASPPAVWLPDGRIVQPSIRDAERMQGFPASWTEPAQEVAKRGVRWKLVGNAVTVKASEWLGERLLELDGDTSLPGTEISRHGTWPRAAWNVDGAGGRRFGAALSTWPVRKIGTPLAEFLEEPKLLLSERATAGFLLRFKQSSLRRPAGFVKALEAHLERVRSAGGVSSPPAPNYERKAAMTGA